MRLKSRIDKTCTYGVTNFNQFCFVVREWVTNKDYYKLPEIGKADININYYKQPSKIYKATSGSYPIFILK